MREGAGRRILRGADAERQLFHQRQMVAAAGCLGMADQCQNRDGAAAQLDLVAHVHQERGLAAIAKRRRADQFAHQVAERALDRGGELRIAQHLPGLDHRIGGAGMAQRVVSIDLSVEAGMIAVDEAAILTDLSRKVAGAAADQCRHVLRRQRVELPPAAFEAAVVQGYAGAVRIGEYRLGREHEQRLIVRKVDLGRRPVFATRVDGEVALVHHCVGDGVAAIEHGIGVEFLLQEGTLELRVERDAVTEIVALDLAQADLQLCPAGGFDLVDPLHAQPARRISRSGRLDLCGQPVPRRFQALAARGQDPRSAASRAESAEERDRRGQTLGWRPRAHEPEEARHHFRARHANILQSKREFGERRFTQC